MAATLINERFYKTVSADATEELTINIANGEKLSIYKCGGNSCYATNVKVEITVAGETVFVTHGDDQQILEYQFTAQEATALKLRLVNGSSQPESIGVFIEAKKY